METIKINTTQHVDIDYAVAGLGERVAAWLIDLAILIVTFFVFLLFFSISGVLGNNEMLINALLIIYGCLFVFYDLLCETLMNGQSIGKKILKIKVVSLDGAQASLGQYFIRWLFRIVDFPLTSWLGGLICIAVTDHKQRIGDIVAGTSLIKTKLPTQFEEIAFHPTVNDYVPIFDHVNRLTDKDIELVHEVLITYYKTGNYGLVSHMATRISNHLSISIPQGMNEFSFLETIVKDYTHVTSKID